MDYCSCGAQAEGRCVIDGAFFCARERRTYPGTIARILDQAGSPPPANWRNGLLCPSCYQDTIGAALPQVTAHLLAEERSVERLAVRLAERAGWWSDSVNGYHSVGVDIVTAAAGTRPDWLFANVTATMAALYATLARRRSLAPPAIEVLHEQTRPAPTLFNRKRTVRTTTRIGEVRAWPFTFRDTDRGFPKLLLVAASGTVVRNSAGWQVVNDTVTTVGSAGQARDEFARVRDALAAAPAEQSLDPEAAGVFVGAIEPLLP